MAALFAVFNFVSAACKVGELSALAATDFFGNGLFLNRWWVSANMQATNAQLDTAGGMSVVRCDGEASDASDKHSSNVVWK